MVTSENTELDSLKRHPQAFRVYTEYAGMKFTKVGPLEYAAPCPFHQDKNPSFRVFKEKRAGIWLFKCMSQCGISGNVMQFVELKDKVPFAEAVRRVKKFYGGSWESRKSKVEEVFKPYAAEEAKEYKTIPLATYAPLETALEQSQAAK